MLKLGNGWLKRFLSDLLDDRDDDQVIADINLLLGLDGSGSIADLVANIEQEIQNQEVSIQANIDSSHKLINQATHVFNEAVEKAEAERSTVVVQADAIIKEQRERLSSLKDVREAIARMSKKIN